MTCAGILKTSPLLPKISATYIDVILVMHAPRQTSMWVLIPAALPCLARSLPIRLPITTAAAALMSVSMIISVIIYFPLKKQKDVKQQSTSHPLTFFNNYISISYVCQ